MKIYLLGIKGTGMCALAELLKAQGIEVWGADVEDEFYTDALLKDLDIFYYKGFSKEHITKDIDLVIYSAAYGEGHEEFDEIKAQKIPVLVYPEAMGALSKERYSYAISGVHGKTTTSALAGSLVQALQLPGSVLVGSAVPSFGNRSTLVQGQDFFIAETCEYRRHFMNFSPDVIILTSVEADHLDYFKDYKDIRKAFIDFILTLPLKGVLIYCADDKGASETAAIIGEKRGDISLIPYGFSLQEESLGALRKVSHSLEENHFTLGAFDTIFKIRVPGDHVILDAGAALLALAHELKRKGEEISSTQLNCLVKGIFNFSGTKRRSEILGEAQGILFMDDYAHHPTAIKTTLKGLKEFYPNRRLVVDFMSHTYSRTEALLEDFAGSFDDADLLILHKIYGSAREEQSGLVRGQTLFEKTLKQRKKRETTFYFEEPDEALGYLRNTLSRGDLFITMGAGDNWLIGRTLFNEFKNKEELIEK